MAIIGYARVSTLGRLSAQLDAILRTQSKVAANKPL